jgi:hypothetical protein
VSALSGDEWPLSIELVCVVQEIEAELDATGSQPTAAAASPILDSQLTAAAAAAVAGGSDDDPLGTLTSLLDAEPSSGPTAPAAAADATQHEQPQAEEALKQPVAERARSVSPELVVRLRPPTAPAAAEDAIVIDDD